MKRNGYKATSNIQLRSALSVSHSPVMPSLSSAFLEAAGLAGVAMDMVVGFEKVVALRCRFVLWKLSCSQRIASRQHQEERVSIAVAIRVLQVNTAWKSTRTAVVVMMQL